MTKEKTKAPPLYIPASITRVFVSHMKVLQSLYSSEYLERGEHRLSYLRLG